LLAALAQAPHLPEAIVVDGYVWLGPERRPGLGARLFEALAGASAVVGVAKAPFFGTVAAPVRRGHSQRPLWVTAAGIEDRDAAAHIESMHGQFRIPTLLKAVDRSCRSAGQSVSD
jgi:deoxyribonuclease V